MIKTLQRKFQTKISIKAESERVFDSFISSQELRQWMPNVKRREIVEGVDGEAGCVTKKVIVFKDRHYSMKEELITLDRPKLLELYLMHDQYNCQFRIQFVKQGSTTKMICDNQIKWKKWWMAIFNWPMGVFLGRQQMEELQAFKNYLESN